MVQIVPTVRVIARLNPEDLERWREVHSRAEAFRLNPRVFTKEESINAIRAEMDFLGYIWTYYEVGADDNWFVSASTGAITVEF